MARLLDSMAEDQREVVKTAILGMLANAGKVLLKNPIKNTFRALGVGFTANEVANAGSKMSNAAGRTSNFYRQAAPMGGGPTM